MKKESLCAISIAAVMASFYHTTPASATPHDTDSTYIKFQNPPKGYGEVPFYWWLGDTLTREHLTDHLDQLTGKHISSLQVNYAHSDKGGKSWGLTYKSSPSIFTEEWWELFRWFAHEAKERGMTVSLSDYTLGVGQEQYVDEIINKRPEMMGYELRYDKATHTVTPHRITPSFNPMHPDAGKEYISHFFQRFEDRLGEDADNLNFFFSDELDFKLRGWLWDERFSEEFLHRKGYDITPHLAALFEDDYANKARYRLDYNDVMVSLSEENFFRPIYEWHQQRGLTYGCDHGGRGKDVTEFGDYFRTQRWNQAPGCDQPNLQHDVVKNKVASSIAHLYERPRVWLEGFYGSGWHTSSAMLTDALFANYAQGQNLLSLHGLYYSTPDSRWEWAPPCNHFRMPYWQHIPKLLECMERLSYLLSQGVHCADIAIIYPVESVVAGDGESSVSCAFNVANTLYAHGYDFDFMDYQSLAKAEVTDRKLQVAGEKYSILIVPGMQSLLDSTADKIAEFQKGGGIVLYINKVSPQCAPSEAIPEENIIRHLASSFVPDFHAPSEKPFVNHRQIADKHLYAVYNVPQGTECFFRAKGAVQLWNPWNGKRESLSVNRTDSTGTYLSMPLDKSEIQLLVFNPDEEPVTGSPTPTFQTVMELTTGWTMTPVPCLNNRWGDYHWPSTEELIVPEVRKIRHTSSADKNWKSSNFDDSDWTVSTLGFDTYFKYSGPLADTLNIADISKQQVETWHPYNFSWRYGVEGDCGHQGYHGLKAEMSDDFIRLGNLQSTGTGMIRNEHPARHHYLATFVTAPSEGNYFVLTGESKPAQMTINGQQVLPGAKNAHLNKGTNFVVLHYIGATSAHLSFATTDTISNKGRKMEMTWNARKEILPQTGIPTAERTYYRFATAPGTRKIEFHTPATRIRAWQNGKKAKVEREGTQCVITLPLKEKSGTMIAIELHSNDSKHKNAAAFTSFIRQICDTAEAHIGDWGEVAGLEYYSGGMKYARKFQMDRIEEGAEYEIDLGDVVSSAEVKINGHDAGIRLTAPWTFDLSPYIRKGDNYLEITVYNTVSNHFRTIPTMYNQKQQSGLLKKPLIKKCAKK